MGVRYINISSPLLFSPTPSPPLSNNAHVRSPCTTLQSNNYHSPFLSPRHKLSPPLPAFTSTVSRYFFSPLRPLSSLKKLTDDSTNTNSSPSAAKATSTSSVPKTKNTSKGRANLPSSPSLPHHPSSNPNPTSSSLSSLSIRRAASEPS